MRLLLAVLLLTACVPRRIGPPSLGGEIAPASAAPRPASPSASPPPPSLSSPQIVPPTVLLPLCAEFDSVEVEAYWSPLPWRNGERWIRIDATLPSTPEGAPVVTGCSDASTEEWRGPGIWQPGPEPFDVGCVPMRAMKTMELRADFLCRMGPLKRTLVARIHIDPEKKEGVRLPVRVSALPPTPSEEQNGGTELAVWRSRAELPAWLAPHFPAQFDFDRFMVAGPDVPLRPTSGVIVVDAPSPGRLGHVLLLDVLHPAPPCPPCQGIYNPNPYVRLPKAEPLRLWKLPRQDGKVFLREYHQMCPPCLAP